MGCLSLEYNNEVYYDMYTYFHVYMYKTKIIMSF